MSRPPRRQLLSFLLRKGEQLADVPQAGQPLVSASDFASLVPATGGHAKIGAGALPFAQDRFHKLLDEECRKFAEADKNDGTPAGKRPENIAKVACMFKDRIAGLAKARGIIPPRVVHDRVCQGLCQKQSHTSVWRLSRRLFCKIADISAEVGDALDDFTTVMVVEVESKNQGGRFKKHQLCLA